LKKVWALQSQNGMDRDIHFQITRLAQLGAHYDLRLGTLLMAGLRGGVHVRGGFDSFADYAEALFGLSPRQTAARIRVAVALQRLPQLSAALGDGLLRWPAVRELTRVATAQTEAAWIDYAEHATAIELRAAVQRCLEASDIGGLGPHAGSSIRVLAAAPLR